MAKKFSMGALIAVGAAAAAIGGGVAAYLNRETLKQVVNDISEKIAANKEEEDLFLEFEKIGMVNHVVPAEELMNTAIAMAEKIASKAQVAIRTSKMALRRGIDCDINTAVTYEALAFATCFGTEDQKDAMKAFVEKRKLEKFKNR